jgi:hypothetical protein
MANPCSGAAPWPKPSAVGSKPIDAVKTVRNRPEANFNRVAHGVDHRQSLSFVSLHQLQQHNAMVQAHPNQGEEGNQAYGFKAKTADHQGDCSS